MLTKHTSCNCKCKFDGIKCNWNQKWNNDKYLCECKNSITLMFRILVHLFVKLMNILKSTVDDLVITCNEILDGLG